MNAKWIEDRRKGIGGSDAGAICGVSPYRTPLQVWQDKRGLSGVVPDNNSMEWGRLLEPVIRQKYSDKTGRAVKILSPDDPIIHHPQYPFMLANLDGFTDDQRVVEIKTAKFPAGWGEPGSDEIPMVYIFQVQHYMAITGFPIADVAVLIGGSDFRLYEVPADKEMQEMMIEKEVAFWKLVQDATPPPPVNLEDVERLYRKSHADIMTATMPVVESLKRLQKIKGSIELLEADEEKEKAFIFGYMKDADTLSDIDGSILATWKNAKSVSRVDLKALQKEQPEVYKKYLRVGESARRFLLKGDKS